MLAGTSDPRRSNCYELGAVFVDPAAYRPEVSSLYFLTHDHGDHLGADPLPQTRALPRGASDLPAGAAGHTWSILQTPGHAADHACLWDGHTLIGGDLIEGDGSCLIPEDGDSREHIRQLRIVARLGARILLPGHGAPIVGTGACLGALLGLADAREAEEVRVLRALRGRPLRIVELFEPVYGGPRTMGAANLLSHLQALRKGGDIRREDAPDVSDYDARWEAL
jgi:glyoxylase-like metal-dependent hydrolase (beta-lactamase superfamily II)